MKQIKRLFRWALAHLSYIQATLTFLVTVISATAGLCKDQLALIVTLLIFVGTEFTIITIGYLEQIKKTIENKNSSTDVEEIIVNGSQKWIDLADKAKKDIFLSGVTMESLCHNRRTLFDISDNIQINILVHNPNDISVTEMFCKVCKPKAQIDTLRSKQRIFNALAKELLVRKNVCIKMTNDPLYMQFVACDIENESINSYIRAQHCLRKYSSEDDNPQIDDELIYGAKKGSPVYEVYRNQIIKLWAASVKYIYAEV